MEEWSFNIKIIKTGECNHCGACCIGCDKHMNNHCSDYEHREERCIEYPTVGDYFHGLPKQCSYKFETIIESMRK